MNNNTSKPTCPYCGCKHTNYGLAKIGFITCISCGKTFYYRLNTKSTFKEYIIKKGCTNNVQSS